MSSAPTQSGSRNPARTQRAVLDAALLAVREHGSGVSLDVVAKAAGVSKGGLMHHFRSKDELFVALADDLVERFRAAVFAAVEPSDLAPGRTMRGYLRVVFAQYADLDEAVEYATVMSHLAVHEPVRRRLDEDTARWKVELTADGLHPDAMELVMLAATGLDLMLFDHEAVDEEQLRSTRDHLMALTRAGESLAALMRSGEDEQD